MSAPDREKPLNAIIFFAKSTRHCSKHKLLQLLYVLDFEHFRRTGRSVTGLEYSAWERGPVPTEIDLEFDDPKEDFRQAIHFSPDPMWNYYMYSILPRRDWDPTVFTPVERDILREVAAQFHSLYANDMTNHAGGAWDRVWRAGQGHYRPIPYELARLCDEPYGFLAAPAKQR